MSESTQDIFDPANEVKSVWLKWGQPKDFIEGTLIDIREIESQIPGKEGEMNKIYEIRANSGSFHDLDEKKNPVPEATVLAQGDVWTVGGKPGIDSQMRNAKIGQKVGMRFVEEKPSKTKGFNPTKVIKIFLGAMDTEFQGELPGDESPM